MEFCFLRPPVGEPAPFTSGEPGRMATELDAPSISGEDLLQAKGSALIKNLQVGSRKLCAGADAVELVGRVTCARRAATGCVAGSRQDSRAPLTHTPA